jgi:hypothetical protein
LTFTGPCIVIYFYSKTNKMHQFFNFILLCSSTLHVLDGLSVHHQESKTVHTASGICQTDSADCLLAGTECTIFQNKFEKIVLLVGFTIQIHFNCCTCLSTVKAFSYFVFIPKVKSCLELCEVSGTHVSLEMRPHFTQS